MIGLWEGYIFEEQLSKGLEKMGNEDEDINIQTGTTTYEVSAVFSRRNSFGISWISKLSGFIA